MVKNLRQKQRSSESGDEDNGKQNGDDESSENSRASPAIQIASVSETLAKSKPSNANILSFGGEEKDSEVGKLAKSKPSTASLLSFADEEDEAEVEVFQVKKPSQSRRLAKIQKRLQAQADHERDREEKLAEEKAAEIKSEKQKKKSKDGGAQVLAGKEAEDFLPQDFAPNSVEKTKFGVKSGEIPDANLIYLARKRRQMARDSATAGGSDFIPLDETKNRSKNEKSRLIREDENDLSEDEEGEGRQMLSMQAKIEAERRRQEENFLEIEQGDDEDPEKDEEFDNWEAEQLKKAISAQKVADYQAEHYGYYVAMNYLTPGAKPDAETGENLIPLPMDFSADDEIEILGTSKGPKIGGGFSADEEIKILGNSKNSKIGGGSSNAGKSVSLDDIRAKLRKTLEERISVSRTWEMDRDRIQENLIENRVTLEELEESGPKLAEEYAFYQETREFLNDLLDCFNEKVKINH